MTSTLGKFLIIVRNGKRIPLGVSSKGHQISSVLFQCHDLMTSGKLTFKYSHWELDVDNQTLGQNIQSTKEDQIQKKSEKLPLKWIWNPSLHQYKTQKPRSLRIAVVIAKNVSNIIEIWDPLMQVTLMLLLLLHYPHYCTPGPNT